MNTGVRAPRRPLLLSLLIAVTTIASLSVAQMSPASAASGVHCSDFSTNPTLGLAGNPVISDLQVTTFSEASPRCEVEFILSTRGGAEHGYTGEGERQRIGIRVGLPLNGADGGEGGLEGAWNGRIRNLGGGGSVGSFRSVTPATDAGYVGSMTDGGHDGEFGHLYAVQPDPNKLNTGRLEDFMVNSVVAQVEWANTLSEAYYGMAPNTRYWEGCSQGGRQGLAVAQERPDLVDGWLVGAPAINYGRFRLAHIWGQLAMKDLVGEPISDCKLSLAVESAVEACDGDDGVIDGIIMEPRNCDYDATDLIGQDTPCGEFTADDVAAIQKTWEGPVNSFGTRIFPGWPRGASLGVTNGSTPFGSATSQLAWNFQDFDFDWSTLAMEDYPEVAELGTEVNGDIIDGRSVDLEEVRDSGKKIIMFHGLADGLIQPGSTLEYYTRVAAHFGGGSPDFGALQSWFRYFRVPGMGHCRGSGILPLGAFNALVDWVESGVEPDHLNGIELDGGCRESQISGCADFDPSDVLRTRPICGFPQIASYTGTGDVSDASSWSCGGNVQTPENICLGLLAKYGKESKKPVDTLGRYNPSQCKHG